MSQFTPIQLKIETNMIQIGWDVERIAESEFDFVSFIYFVWHSFKYSVGSSKRQTFLFLLQISELYILI